MKEHPRDVWIDITVLGDPVPRRILAVSGEEAELAEAEEAYVNGLITVDELERRAGRILTGCRCGDPGDCENCENCG